MDKTVKELREIVSRETVGLHPKYRCHEVARLFVVRLRSLDINATVKDGVVTYDINSLRKYFLSSMDLLDGLSDAVKAEIFEKEAKKKLRVFHSWCEINMNGSEIVVIDWHATLTLSRDETLEGILIIENKKKLPHNYNPVGIEIGEWIFLKRFPPYFTKLRLQKAL